VDGWETGSRPSHLARASGTLAQRETTSRSTVEADALDVDVVNAIADGRASDEPSQVIGHFPRNFARVGRLCVKPRPQITVSPTPTERQEPHAKLDSRGRNRCPAGRVEAPICAS